MNDVCVKIKKLRLGVELPQRATPGSAGFDIRAFLSTTDKWMISPGEVVAIPTGFCMEIPVGYEAQIRTRSGLALKSQIVVVNSPGTVDSDFRGEVKVIIKNLSESEFLLSHGDRIAQMVINKVPDVYLEEVAELTDTERSEGGFGSSGIK